MTQTKYFLLNWNRQKRITIWQTECVVCIVVATRAISLSDSVHQGFWCWYVSVHGGRHGCVQAWTTMLCQMWQCKNMIYKVSVRMC